MVRNREKLINKLSKKGIETKIQHPFIISDHPGLKNNLHGSLKNTRLISKRILSIPVHEKLKRKQLQYIVDNINKFYE